MVVDVGDPRVVVVSRWHLERSFTSLRTCGSFTSLRTWPGFVNGDCCRSMASEAEKWKQYLPDPRCGFSNNKKRLRGREGGGGGGRACTKRFVQGRGVREGDGVNWPGRSVTGTRRGCTKKWDGGALARRVLCDVREACTKRTVRVVGEVGREYRGNPRRQYQMVVMTMFATKRITEAGNGHNVIWAGGCVRSASHLAERRNV